MLSVFIAQFKFEAKKSDYLMFQCVLQTLASQRKEGTDQLFFLYWTTFCASCFSSYVHPSCWMQVVHFTRHVWVMEGVTEWRASLEWVLNVNLSIRVYSYQSFPSLFHLFHQYFQPEITVSPFGQEFLLFRRIKKVFYQFITSSTYIFLFHWLFPPS